MGNMQNFQKKIVNTSNENLLKSFIGLDHHFAEYINSIAKNPSTELYYATALSVYLLGEGHIRFDLSKYSSTKFSLDETSGSHVTLPDLEQWIDKLINSGVVGRPGDYYPIILDKTYCYLYRYWKYENECAVSLLNRTGFFQNNYSDDEIKRCIQKLFSSDTTSSCQLIAAISAILNTFTVITGGPGTGKTTTVAKIVALLLQLNSEQNFRIALAAPTGKAAMRLSESLSRARQSITLPESIAKSFPVEAFTIHRLLGTISNSTEFRFNKNNPLPYDLVIIDEASMIDIALMSKLLSAIHPKCRLILLGDKDQLASVEAGSVLGDICDTGTNHLISEKLSRRIAVITNEIFPFLNNELPLADSIVTLDKSYRFNSNSGIGLLSKSINNGNFPEVKRILDCDPDCSLKNITDLNELRITLTDTVHKWCESLCKEQDPETALSLLDNFRILCALRHGSWGISTINKIIKGYCVSKKLVTQYSSVFNGLPIMIQANDYRYNLFNGDTGIIIEQGSSYKAFFRSHDGTIRSIPLRMVTFWEVAYAITVHKSQGSEFTETLLLLPPKETPLLTRELIYTAITRSRQKVAIWCNETVLKKGIETVTDRDSGMRDKLWS